MSAAEIKVEAHSHLHFYKKEKLGSLILASQKDVFRELSEEECSWCLQNGFFKNRSKPLLHCIALDNNNPVAQISLFKLPVKKDNKRKSVFFISDFSCGREDRKVLLDLLHIVCGECRRRNADFILSEYCYGLKDLDFSKNDIFYINKEEDLLNLYLWKKDEEEKCCLQVEAPYLLQIK